ncbi:MAG: SAM-dependent methyltransferase [Lachnospiraceae bacterium]|nr:SAM-dependent methyltransferase [Lachnospiraceae bacterium]
MGESLLSGRLKCVADMVSPVRTVYDVGCDHAHLAVYLVNSQKAEKAVASDVRPGPLRAAAANIRAAGLEDRISTVLSDGLHNIPKPDASSALIIAGMGGPLILRILSDCPDTVSGFDEIIISPQSRIRDVRAHLPDLGWWITDEDMVFDAGKYYTVIKLTKERQEYAAPFPDVTPEDYGELRLRYGPVLINRPAGILKDYLDWELSIYNEVVSGLDPKEHGDRLEEVKRDISLNQILTGGLYGYDQNRR